MTDAVESQDDVFAYLGRPSTHGGADVRRIDTHAAVVFLAAERAYKVKRAVRFPFLDFSTLEKRREACIAEIDANRPFAPAIYCRVVAITREPSGALAIGGAGEPVEYAVEMRRFDETKTLDRLADHGAVDLALADSLARAVAAAHARAPVVAAAPWIDALGAYVDQNDAAFREYPALFPAAAIERLAAASRAALSRIRPLLSARGTRGLVRRGHGDLHLGNIALIDGRPVPFDALEFDPLVASGDVLYDLAFLLMDLVERRLQPAANVVLNRYLAETRRAEDLDALTTLPFLMSMRAAIRAKVTAARAACRTRVRSGCDRKIGDDVFRTGGGPDRAAAAHSGRGRRAVGHRQIGAGPRTRAGPHACAGRRRVALRRRAQGAVRCRPKPSVCRRMPTPRTSRRAPTRRSSTRRAA